MTGLVTSTRPPADVLQSFGRRRLAWYAFVATSVAVAFGGYAVYLIVEVALERRSGWILAMLPGFLAVFAFSGLLAYGGWYMVVNGRQWPKAPRVDRFYGVLSNTYVLPRRRRRPKQG